VARRQHRLWDRAGFAGGAPKQGQPGLGTVRVSCKTPAESGVHSCGAITSGRSPPSRLLSSRRKQPCSKRCGFAAALNLPALALGCHRYVEARRGLWGALEQRCKSWLFGSVCTCNHRGLSCVIPGMTSHLSECRCPGVEERIVLVRHVNLCQLVLKSPAASQIQAAVSADAGLRGSLVSLLYRYTLPAAAAAVLPPVIAESLAPGWPRAAGDEEPGYNWRAICIRCLYPVIGPSLSGLLRTFGAACWDHVNASADGAGFA
jgi:hypothetical protein